MNRKKQVIGLIGNPNSGKSTLFNTLTGLRQKVGNFPGVTVDKKLGTTILPSGKEITVLDIPGTYSLYPNSTEERLVVDLITNKSGDEFPDAIIYVADVTQLEKHLLLATQLIDLGFPMVICLNMTDLLSEESKEINTDALSSALNIPVIQISAKLDKNIDVLLTTVDDILENSKKIINPFYQFSEIERSTVDRLAVEFPQENEYALKLKAHHFTWLKNIGEKEKQIFSAVVVKEGFENIKLQISETLLRYQKIKPLSEKTISSKSDSRINWTEKIDNIITHRFWGLAVFLLINLLIFQAVFSWSEYPMTLIEEGFASLGNIVRNRMPNAWITDLLVDGIIAGLGGILVFIPQITLLFLIIAVLEEVGYMARAVFLFDGILKKVGLNGRSVVSLISSSACAIPAIMATRTISDWKERLITIMVAPLISCSARIPVYTVLVGFVVSPGSFYGFNKQGLAFMGLYLMGIIASLIAAFVFKKIIQSKDRSFLMIELPQYHPPIVKNILLTVKEKVLTFIVEAGKVIMIISIILWFLASYGPSSAMVSAEKEATTFAKTNNLTEEDAADYLSSQMMEASYAGHLGKFIEPAIKPLGFDWKIGIALITSFAAREVFVGTMATIYSVGSSDDEATLRDKMNGEINTDTGGKRFDMATSLSLLVFYVFAMQCMSTLAVTKRETKTWKWPIIQFVYMGVLAYLGSFIVYQLFS